MTLQQPPFDSPEPHTRRASLQKLCRFMAPTLLSPLAIRKLAAQPRSSHPGRDAVRFFFVTDTHYLAQKESPDQMDGTSASICRRLVETLNQLDGQTIPDHAGGGQVGEVRGVIHGGDVVDSADKRGPVYDRMSATEFAAFQRDYGLTGQDGLLHYPVYEVYGNHDGPHGDTLVIEGIKARNRRRPGLAHVSDNGLHYSWDWGGVHLINLGIVVGQSGPNLQRRRYAPMDSLDFLRQDLARLSDQRQPIVLTQHIDVTRHSHPYTQDEERFLNMEWHPQDVQAFYQTIRPYHVLGDFFGHTHVRNVYGWNGSQQRQPSGDAAVTVFNGDNASHFSGDKQAFFYVEIQNAKMLVREVITSDGWNTFQWSPQVWS